METGGSASFIIHLVKLSSSFVEAAGPGHLLDPSFVSQELLAPQVSGSSVAAVFCHLVATLLRAWCSTWSYLTPLASLFSAAACPAVCRVLARRRATDARPLT
eukprot:2600656-Pleurochrysis_carterae.AAC.1